MCGIFGYTGDENNAAEVVLEGLKRLEYRGYDSWGIVYKAKSIMPHQQVAEEATKLKTQNLLMIKEVGKIGDVVIRDVQTDMALGHTRWATHGGVTQVNAHPHTDCSGQLAVVHNGIIENFQELKRELKKKGHNFSSETDTEIIAHLIEDLYQVDTDPEKSTLAAFSRLEGRNAAIAFFVADGIFTAVKNGSPLILGQGEKANYISSDAAALIPHTKKVLYLENGEAAIVGRKKIRLLSIKRGTQTKSDWQKLEWDEDKAEKGSYEHFYLKEVDEQGAILTDTITQNEQTVREFADLIKSSYGTYFVGAGSAYYACLTGSYIFSKIAKRHINVIPASEFPYIKDFIRPDSLVTGVSQSGETADLLEAIEGARSSDARIGAIVNVVGSSLYREADKKFPLRAGPEKAVLATKSFTSMLTAFYLLSFTLMGEYKRGREVLIELTARLEEYLAREEIKQLLRRIAGKFLDKQNIFVLGRGLNYPIALEAALKIKESSYIHAEGFAGGELKHGVIALVEEGTPFIVFVPDDETYKDTISNIMEVKSRGARIIAVSSDENEIFDHWIPVPDLGDMSPIINIVPAQLLAYYLTVGLGRDPDKPRNLAKSVTVK